MAVLLYSNISNFTFWSVNILKCKILLIGFLYELGNMKQKIFYISKCNFFYILQQRTQIWKWQAYLLVPVYKPPPKITNNHPLEPCTLGMLASPKLTLDFFIFNSDK